MQPQNEDGLGSNAGSPLVLRAARTCGRGAATARSASPCRLSENPLLVRRKFVSKRFSKLITAHFVSFRCGESILLQARCSAVETLRC
jgi:hypothetical protein